MSFHFFSLSLLIDMPWYENRNFWHCIQRYSGFPVVLFNCLKYIASFKFIEWNNKCSNSNISLPIFESRLNQFSNHWRLSNLVNNTLHLRICYGYNDNLIMPHTLTQMGIIMFISFRRDANWKWSYNFEETETTWEFSLSLIVVESVIIWWFKC